MQTGGDRPGPTPSEDPEAGPADTTDGGASPGAASSGASPASSGASPASSDGSPATSDGSPATPGASPAAPDGADRETAPAGPKAPTRRVAGGRSALPWLIALAVVVLAGLALRLWGIRWGLPYAYNLDERSHFVPRAVAFFQENSLDPDYQLNPSGLIEWFAAVLWVLKGGSDGVVRAWNTDPESVWAIARISAAVLSTAAIALLYAAGARLFDRRVGLVAAAILAFAFLPTHYGHLALNDGPSLAPTALALWAIAGVVRFGRRRDYLIAGAAIGVAFGLKYNAAFVGLPLLTAAAIHALGWRPATLRARDVDVTADDRRERASATTRLVGAAESGGTSAKPRRVPHVGAAVGGLVLAAIAGFVCFFVLDPYAVLRPGFFLDEVEHLSDYTKGGLLLGETQRSGYRYYAWTLLWGFGVLPLVLAVVGGVRGVLRDRWQALLLIPAPLIFFAYVGAQGRYFARYGMPVYPLLAILAAAGAVWLGTWLLNRAGTRGGRVRVALGTVGVLVVLAQGLVLVVHNDVVLTREDTRTTARKWMVENIPARTTIVVEPVVPREWYADAAVLQSKYSRAGYRWERLTRTGDDKRALIKKHPELASKIRRAADFANHGFTLFPGMLDFYREKGACWIVSGSLQSGRVMNNPRRVPEAVKYYRALEQQSDLRFEIDPFDGPEAKHYFQYDMAFNFGQLRYERPGPSMRVYRLRDCTPRVVPEQS
ncbi:glycosyltransferase family 39 protein [Patulibacter americanus]|uniref:glycosyltransferase family 39 protein n=1 Tax=Patulibacter americanus TaxID=588672 RepID=UPI0003B76AAB|nr:glycosyltransferase family 39 protein [Patulibacter americanus]